MINIISKKKSKVRLSFSMQNVEHTFGDTFVKKKKKNHFLTSFVFEKLIAFSFQMPCYNQNNLQNHHLYLLYYLQSQEKPWSQLLNYQNPF